MNLNNLNTKEGLNNKITHFIYSDFYLILLTILGIIGFYFEIEIYIIGLYILIFTFNLIFVRDVSPNLIILGMLSMVPLARYGIKIQAFFPLMWILPLLFIGLVVHFILYPPPVHKKSFYSGEFTIAQLVIAIIITFSGLFGPYFALNFKIPALYYVSFLGFGMLIFYLFINYYIPNKSKIIKYNFKMFMFIGILGASLIFMQYIKFGNLLANQPLVFLEKHLQLGNNVSNILLLTMPLTLYFATKGKNVILYYILGFLQYFAMLLSMSRGGIIFGTIMFPIIFISTLINVKSNKKKLQIVSVTILFAMILAILLMTVFKPYYNELINKFMIRVNSKNPEARVGLYKHAVEMFKKFPIWGAGLGYRGNVSYHPKPMALYWYHSTVFQIIGSIGIIGIIGYLYQYWARLKSLLIKINKMHLFILLSFMAYESYQLVNVGNFVPFPTAFLVLHLFVISEKINKTDFTDKEIEEDKLVFHHKIFDKVSEICKKMKF